jgi:4a-hydroxytetrahydrobiopterin dehydratase
MSEEVPNWTLKDTLITREFQFKDFLEAMVFVNKVADAAEGQQHHPEILVKYKKVRLTLTTDKIGGLSQNDFIMAARIDLL